MNHAFTRTIEKPKKKARACPYYMDVRQGR